MNSINRPLTLFLRSYFKNRILYCTSNSVSGTTNKNKNPNLEVDPFGFEGEDLVPLVQGVYLKNSPKSKIKKEGDNEESSEKLGKKETKGPNINIAPLNEEDERVNTYKGWIQARVDQKKATNDTSEIVRKAHFGNIRLDKENIPKFDGQFEDIYTDPDPEVDKKHTKYASEFKEEIREIKRQSKNQNESLDSLKKVQAQAEEEKIITKIKLSKSNLNIISESIESKQPVLETKVEDIKSPNKEIKNEASIAATQQQDEDFEEEEDDEEEELKKEDSKPKGKTAFEYLNEHKEETASSMNLEYNFFKKNPHIPKVYQCTNFNNLTHDEMFYFLKNKITYENNYLLALNKPLNIPMHDSNADCRHKIIDFLDKFAELCKCEKIYPLHRLDKDTTGLLLFAKTEKAAAVLKSKFAKGSIDKTYMAVTKNVPKLEHGVIQIPIGLGQVPSSGEYRANLKPDLRHFNIQGRKKDCVPATTKYKVIKESESCSLLELKPETGIKHQIRIHLGAGIDCPILGDHKYSHPDKMAPQRLHPWVLDQLNIKQSKVRFLPIHLHSYRMIFTMPKDIDPSLETIYLHARLPLFFIHTLHALRLK